MGQLLTAYLNTNHLHVALKNDSTWLSIRMLLFCGLDVNKRDHYGCTPLHIAILHKNPDDVIRLLAKKGTDIDAVDNNGLTPLHMAIQEGCPINIIQYLLKCGANVNIMDVERNTAVHFAAIHKCQDTLNIIELLLKNFSNINIQNVYGETVLHLGVKHELDLIVIKFLLMKGADPSIQNQWGGNCLHYCMLYSKDSPNIIDIAMLLLKEETTGINSKDQAGDTALHMAVRNGLSPDVIDTLCKHGADSAIQNNLGCTPLHYTQSTAVMDILFQRKSVVNVQDKRSSTALHHMFKNKTITASFLKKALLYGCDPNLQDYQGRNVFHTAIIGSKHSDYHLFLIIKYLLKHMRNINATDINGDTALHLAVRGNIPNDCIHILLDSGACPDIKNKHGVSPLAEFHHNQNIDCSKLLLVIYKSSDVNVRDMITGCTFLHRAIHGFKRISCNEERLCDTDNLLKIGLDPNAIVERHNDLWTPLVEALQLVSKMPCKNSLSIVENLYRSGAYPNMRINKQKQTAIEILVKRFLEKGSNKINEESYVTKECLFLSLKAGLSMHKIGSNFILAVMKHFVIMEDWNALRRLFKYGITINHLQANESDKTLLLQVLMSCNYLDFYPLSLFELSANVLRVHLWPNCFKGLDNLVYLADDGALHNLPGILKDKIKSAPDSSTTLSVHQ